MNQSYYFVSCLSIGFVAGLRSMTAPAVVAWAARIGWLHLTDSPLAFMGSTAAVVLLSLFALGELVADKLPQTPSRTTLLPLLARVLTGGLCGACLCASAHLSVLIGLLLGGIGGVVGAFVGYKVRKTLVSRLNLRDIWVAIPEDVIAIGLALFLVSR